MEHKIVGNKFKTIRSPYFPQAKRANCWRVRIGNKKIVIDFGKSDNKKKEVFLISSVSIEPQDLIGIISSLMEVGIVYQETTGEDIGFTKEDNLNEDEFADE